MAEKKLKITVTEKGSKQAAAQAKGLTSSYKKVAGSIAGMVIAYQAVTKAAKFFSESIKLASEQEAIFKKLETATNLTGKSYDNLSDSLKSYLAELQATTEYGDTETAAALTQMTQLSGDFDASLKGLPIALDLAATGLFSLETASKYVGMALAGNVEMLGRYIPELKSTVTPQLKLMSAAEKTAFAMDLLQKKFGGTAQKNLDTYAGKVKQLQNYWGDFREMIGDKVIPILSKGVVAATGFMKSLTQTSLQKTIDELKRYGVAVETIQELEKLGLELNLIEMESQLKKINDEGLTRKQIEAQINDNIKKRTVIAGKLASEQIKLQSKINELADYKNNSEKNHLGLITMNAAQKIAGIKSEIAWLEKGAITYERQADVQDKLLEKDKEKIESLAKIVKLEQQIAILSGEAIDFTPPVIPDMEIKSVDIPIEYDIPPPPDITEIPGGPITDQIAEDLQRRADLQTEYDERNITDQEAARQAELDQWKAYRANNIIGEDEYQRMLLAIDEKYANARENISARATSSQIRDNARLVGSIGDLGAALGAEANLVKHFKAAEATMNAYAAFNAYNALVPPQPVLAWSALVGGLANVIAIEATGFQFGTDGYQVPAGFPNDSYMFAAKSGENISVTPAGKESGNGNSALIDEVRMLRTALANQVRYEIRTVDDVEISEMAETGNYRRARI